MTIKRNHFDKNVFYFCTVTCFKWLNLISQTNIYEKIYDMFDILKENQCPVVRYVIMPNHFHFQLFQYENSKLLNKLIGNGKRFLAYDIIDRLRMNCDYNILQFLNISISQKLKLNGNKHRVFNDSFDASICETESDVISVLDYMHYNPVVGKWKLVENYLEYKHSSARFYELGEPPYYKNLTDYRDILHGNI